MSTASLAEQCRCFRAVHTKAASCLTLASSSLSESVYSGSPSEPPRSSRYVSLSAYPNVMHVLCCHWRGGFSVKSQRKSKHAARGLRSTAMQIYCRMRTQVLFARGTGCKQR